MSRVDLTKDIFLQIFQENEGEPLEYLGNNITGRGGKASAKALDRSKSSMLEKTARLGMECHNWAEIGSLEWGLHHLNVPRHFKGYEFYSELNGRHLKIE